MHIDHISFEPNSSYVAEGKHSMGGASITNFQITIDTDAVGRVRHYSDGNTDDKSLADMWDYQKVHNVATGKVWDLRLHNAASAGKCGLAEVALTEGADVALRIKQGSTALHWAAAKGHEEVAKLLVEHGADVNAADELGWTPAFLADANGFSALVKFFVDRGAKTTAIICGKESSLPIDENPDGELIEAAESGDFDVAKSSVDEGADVNCKSRDGWTPLLIASKDHPEIVELLLANGADPNVASDRGYTPLMRAAGNGNERVVRLLIAAGADKEMVDLNQKTAYQLSIEMHETQCAQLVQPGVSGIERQGDSAPRQKPTDSRGSDLNDAAQKGNLKDVESLLREGADILWKNEFGETALYKASESGHDEIVRALLAAGSDRNTRRLRTAELTLKGDKDAISIFGETALIAAAESGHTDVVQLLVDADADLNAAREDGCTALILAAYFGHTSTVEALLTAGADTGINTPQGVTAAQAARSAGHPKIAQLIEGGAANRPDGANRDRAQSLGGCESTRREILEELLVHYENDGPNHFVPPGRLKAFQKDEGAAFAALSALFREGFISGIFDDRGDMADLDYVATVEAIALNSEQVGEVGGLVGGPRAPFTPDSPEQRTEPQTQEISQGYAIEKGKGTVLRCEPREVFHVAEEIKVVAVDECVIGVPVKIFDDESIGSVIHCHDDIKMFAREGPGHPQLGGYINVRLPVGGFLWLSKPSEVFVYRDNSDNRSSIRLILEPLEASDRAAPKRSWWKFWGNR